MCGGLWRRVWVGKGACDRMAVVAVMAAELLLLLTEVLQQLTADGNTQLIEALRVCEL